MVKISEIIKEIKENVMLALHENDKVDLSLDELKTHNKNIDNCIKEFQKSESKKT